MIVFPVYKMCRFVLLFLLSSVVYICDSYTLSNYNDMQIEYLRLSTDNYTYSVDIGHQVLGWLKFHFMPETWQQARLRCQLEGSVMASPLNEELLDIMKAVMTQRRLHRVFTGISAVYSSGEFASVEGVPFNQIPLTWAPGEPDNYLNQEQCIAVYPNGSLADVRCEHSLPYFCYKKNILDDSIENECNTKDPEYKFDKRTGKCYKLHRFGERWSEAYLTCAAEDGHLVIINSETEAQVLREIIEKHPPKTLHASDKNYFSVGFRDWSDRGSVWMTIHGKTLQEAGYERWAQGNPNNFKNSEYCGGIGNDAILHDINCNVILPFICEKISSVDLPTILTLDEVSFD